MATSKRQYILATFFMSTAAAILSFVSLGTQGWVGAKAKFEDSSNSRYDDYIKFGLFSGTFHRESIQHAIFDLTMVCRFDLNICALLCGDNMGDNLEKLYNNIEDSQLEIDRSSCPTVTAYNEAPNTKDLTPRADGANQEKRVFINSGVWLSTIIFLIISGITGLVAAALAVWNTATNPKQRLLSIFGLYIYNIIAFCSLLLSIILWGAMYANDLIAGIPNYETFLDGFSTKNNTKLGYSYWILIASLVLYLSSICSLFIRNWLIEKQPAKVNVEIENDDARIYLY